MLSQKIQSYGWQEHGMVLGFDPSATQTMEISQRILRGSGAHLFHTVKNKYLLAVKIYLVALYFLVLNVCYLSGLLEKHPLVRLRIMYLLLD